MWHQIKKNEWWSKNLITSPKYMIKNVVSICLKQSYFFMFSVDYSLNYSRPKHKVTNIIWYKTMSLQETVSSWGGWGGHRSWCVRGERRESRECNWDSQTSNWKWWQGWPLTWGYSVRPSSAVCGRCPVGSVCLSWQDCPDLCRVWSWCTLTLSQLSSPSVSYILIFSCE